MPRFPLVAALLVLSTPAYADEFADVDPEHLAKGIEILAEKWTIPIVVFHGATDDFATSAPEEDTSVGTASSFPAIPIQALPAEGCPTDQGIRRDRARYGGVTDCLSGAINRRRED